MADVETQSSVADRVAVRGAPALGEPGMRLASALLERRTTLLEITTRIATYDSAVDELNRSIGALIGSGWELERSRPRPVGRTAVFLPSNNVLYSYVLFGVVPALYSDRVVVRPSARTRAVAEAIHEELGPEVVRAIGERVAITAVSQREFLDVCRGSDVVVFTGQHRNGLDVVRAVGGEPLTLLFGSGPNPLVVGPEADLDVAVRALVAARLYNVGQDCLSPDVVFVRSDRAPELAAALADELARRPAGDRRESGVVPPLVYRDAVVGAAAFLRAHEHRIVWGGHVSVEDLVVEPTVLVTPFALDLHPPEFFSPVFLLVAYDDPREVADWLETPEERARGMYVSIYGESDLSARVIGTSVALVDATTFDVEDGNRPFGGYGVQASGVAHDGRLVGRPLLVSAELGDTGGAA